MCRVLMYRGQPVLIDQLLYQPDNSLIKQTHSAVMLDMLNLAGFGLVAWAPDSHRPDEPFSYRTPHIPIFDRNLKSMAEKLCVSTMIAHVRGVPYNEKVSLGEQNAHPFQFPGMRLALAHNGDLAEFSRMRYALLAHIKPALAQMIRGNTDSEWMYAVFLSQFDDPTAPQDSAQILLAVEAMLRVVRTVRQAHGIHVCSPTNLFISDGEHLVAVRYTFDFGCYDPTNPTGIRQSTHAFLSLWYTTGRDYGLHDGEWKMVGGHQKADSVLIASEPLTRDTSTWLEVPEYSACTVVQHRGRQRLQVKYLDV